MYTCDIHSDGESAFDAIEMLKSAVKLAKKDKDHLLCLITGYGSSGKTHKIRTAVVKYLESNQRIGIKGYILGENVDIFNPVYQNFPYRDKIPESVKNHPNPGAIYIAV